MRSSEMTKQGIYRLRSSLRIVLLALIASLLVFAASAVLQWIVYERLLHRTGQWRFTGTALATILTFLFLYRRQLAEQERQREMQQRLHTIGEMNDKIRNALQIIQVTSYLSQPNATAPIREAVEAIDAALRDGWLGFESSETDVSGSTLSGQTPRYGVVNDERETYGAVPKGLG